MKIRAEIRRAKAELDAITLRLQVDGETKKLLIQNAVKRIQRLEVELAKVHHRLTVKQF